MHVSYAEGDAAIELLEGAISSHLVFVTALGVDPVFARLGPDVRFGRMVSRLGLR